MNGPLLPFIDQSKCCEAALRTCRLLHAPNLKGSETTLRRPFDSTYWVQHSGLGRTQCAEKGSSQRLGHNAPHPPTDTSAPLFSLNATDMLHFEASPNRRFIFIAIFDPSERFITLGEDIAPASTHVETKLLRKGPRRPMSPRWLPPELRGDSRRAPTAGRHHKVQQRAP